MDVAVPRMPEYKSFVYVGQHGPYEPTDFDTWVPVMVDYMLRLEKHVRYDVEITRL